MDPHSAIHHCLLVPEIVSLICDELRTPDLAKLAVVCRRLSAPVLESLWYSIDDAVNVFRGSFSSDLFELRAGTDSVGESSNQWHLAREPTDGDLQDIRRRAARVRMMQVDITVDGLGKMSLDALVGLQAAVAKSGKPLFTNLRSLDIECHTSEMECLWGEETEALSIFFGPGIRNFKLRGPTEDSIPLLRKLLEVAPASKLSQLCFITVERQPFPVDVLRRLTALETITLDHVSSEGLAVLSQLPYLRSFAYIPAWMAMEKLSKDGCGEISGGFRTLKVLSIRSVLEEALLVLQQLRGCPLQRVTIADPWERPLPEVTAILNATLSAAQSDTLESVEIRNDYSPSPHSRDPEIVSTGAREEFIEALGRLCGYPNLQRVHLKPATTPEVPFEVLKRVAKVLPMLTDLTIVQGPLEDPTPTRGFNGYTADQLIALAKMLPNLRSLGLHLDFSQEVMLPHIMDPTRRPGDGFAHANLVELDVGWSREPRGMPATMEALAGPAQVNSTHVGLLLSDIFPRLDVIWTGNIPSDERPSAWEAFIVVVKMLSLARQQSAAHAAMPGSH